MRDRGFKQGFARFYTFLRPALRLVLDILNIATFSPPLFLTLSRRFHAATTRVPPTRQRQGFHAEMAAI
jgi:hypothetical protein